MNTHSLNSYKALTSRIVHNLVGLPPEQRLPVGWASSMIVSGRLRNGARSAALAGCVVGALIERGHADKAEELVKALVQHESFNASPPPA